MTEVDISVQGWCVLNKSRNFHLDIYISSGIPNSYFSTDLVLKPVSGSSILAVFLIN